MTDSIQPARDCNSKVCVNQKEIAKAGDMVILAAMDPFVPILTHPEQRKHLPQQLAEKDPVPVLSASPEELELLLRGGYSKWREYRNQL